MKIHLMLVAALVFVCGTAFAAHGFHVWSKVSEQEGVNGQIVCQWKCAATGYYGEEHYKTTSGYGSCPNAQLKSNTAEGAQVYFWYTYT